MAYDAAYITPIAAFDSQKRQYAYSGFDLIDISKYGAKPSEYHDFIFHILEHELFKSDTNKETVTDQ